ncbi:MAG: hypothetical protein ACSLE6_16340 [Mycobacterium sp.]
MPLSSSENAFIVDLEVNDGVAVIAVDYRRATESARSAIAQL